VADYFAGDYARAADRLRPLSRQTNNDFVLNNCRLGSVAMAGYDEEEAEDAFLRAYEVINSMGVNQGGRGIGAVVVSENIKVWKGEPFERAMANFYLGTLYYMRHDYGNARAAYENALFKLRDYGENGGSDKNKNDEYREQESNFAVGYIMLGRCWLRLGRQDLAEANFQRAAHLRPELADLANSSRHENSNLLLIVDYGRGPRKITTADNSLVGFAPTAREEGPLPQPVVVIDGRPVPMGTVGRAPVDLLELAQDRRWQSIDTIRAVKSALGVGLMAAGAYEGMRRDGNTGAALALIGTGLLLKASSGADLRQWEMLPRTVFLLPLKVPPGKHTISVVFRGDDRVGQTWRGLEVPSEGEATYYLRMQPWNNGIFDWPPPPLHARQDNGQSKAAARLPDR
jgi:tetratricopeptide (TPR) repeat protein